MAVKVLLLLLVDAEELDGFRLKSYGAVCCELEFFELSPELESESLLAAAGSSQSSTLMVTGGQPVVFSVTVHDVDWLLVVVVVVVFVDSSSLSDEVDECVEWE